MIACSFLPAATQMIYDMGLQQYLHGITFECPALPQHLRHKFLPVHQNQPAHV